MNENLILKNDYSVYYYIESIDRCKYWLALFLLLLITNLGAAQNDSASIIKNTSRPKNIVSLNLGAQYGFIFVHSKNAEFSRGSHPSGIEFSLAWQKNDTSALNICNCYPRKGVLLSYYNYDNRALGKMIGAAYFLEPSYRINRTLFFSFRGSVGGAYLTNPADSIHNPENRSYSTAFNFYLMLGAGLRFRLNDHWWLNASVNFQHTSNGGMRLPNLGINWPTAGLALSYQKSPMLYHNGTHIKEKIWKNYSIRWDLYLFGISNKVIVANEKKFYPIVGSGFQGSKQIGRLNALTLGAEFFSDAARTQELKQKFGIDASPLRAGILVGNEFLLGRFLFSQRIGAYVYNQTTYPRLFHRWGLLYRTNPHWSLGFSFLAHGKTANFFDVKVNYSWQKRAGKL
jgi:hypothetical protein